MFIAKTAVRNREIFAAYQKGDLIEDLAKRYGLSIPTLHEVIRIMEFPGFCGHVVRRASY